MKRFLLSLFVALTAVVSANAQDDSGWQWGPATWNIQDGVVFDGIEDFNAKGGLVLTYPNPAEYTLTYFNMIATAYDLFVDDATEPIQTSASGTGATGMGSVNYGEPVPVAFDDYKWVEGHTYRIVTHGSVLAFANLATYSTDTLSRVEDTYSISFTIKGPELVKTIDVEGTMSLSITDQEANRTFSVIDTTAIINALGISSLSEAAIYALASNGSYVSREWHADYFYGWRDADGDYTHWGGGWNAFIGHNAYPAVYAVQLSETNDTLTYFFYDYWREYVPDETGEVPGSELGSAKRRAPETHYNSIVWDWEWEDEEGNPQVTQYTRSYRVDEGSDYVARFIYIANQKSVIVKATLHFVSQEDYANYVATAIEAPEATNAEASAAVEAIYSLNGTPLSSLQKGINIVKYSNGQVKKVFIK